MIKQTTLHNILTWVIAVILFIFQSLNFFIAWIKKYVKHGEKTTTVVTADTTISSESNQNNRNKQENVITVQGLIQKHFDIPLIIAEDEPKVYNFIKSAQLLASNKICKEEKIDQFMENLVDDSYVARGLGLITATVGRQSEFYLYSKYDNNFENIVIRLSGRNGEVGEITILSQNPANIIETKSIPIDYFYDKDRIKVTYTPFAEGVHTLTLVRNSLSICRSPYYISVEKSTTNSRSQIRLGTKKYKPVTKFVKAKHSPLETCDNSIPVIVPSKSSFCGNILPVSVENSTRTDVMSIVTKFESNNISVQKKVYKNASSIPEKGLETDLVDGTSTHSNIKQKIETDNIYYNNFSDLNSHNAQSKSKSTDKHFFNDVDVTYRNCKASDINAKDIESERIKKPMTNFSKNIRTTKDIPFENNVSLTHLKPTNSVLEENINDGNSRDVEKRHQTLKRTEFIDENTQIETLLVPTTRIDEYEIKCIENEPYIQNEVSCFDDDDKKTIVVKENIKQIESNPNDTVIQQITDSEQYNINTLFTSIITKITNSVCEKCSIQLLKILSEFPRDINITHDNNSKEQTSTFETLLAQPISININIDNMFEHTISDTNKQNSEHLLPNSPPKIKSMGTTDKDIKCPYLNENEPIDNNSDDLCGDINNPSTDLMIKTNKTNSEISKKIKDKIVDHCTVPFTENSIDKHKTEDQKNEVSTNEILKIKYSTTNGENVLHSNQFNNDTIYKSDNEMEIREQCLQKSSEHNMSLIKTNQFLENINKELNNISKECDKTSNTSDLVTINNDKNTNEELVITNKFKTNNVGLFKNTNVQSPVVNNTTVLESMEVTKYNLEYNKEKTKNISYKNVTLASTQNEKQKLMIEKSIEPVLTSFKNKMVEKITQLYLNKDLSNTDNATIIETHDKHIINNMKENQINKVVNNTEINTTCIETLTSQLKNHIDKNEISEIILDKKNSGNNHLFNYAENIIKTNINPSDMCAQTLAEKKLQTLVNTAMNPPKYQEIDNEIKKMIMDNETQDFELKKMNNGKIVQDTEVVLAESQSITIIENSNKRIPSNNEQTVETECKLPLINDFSSIEIDKINTDIKQEIQTINENENVTMVKTNAVEIKALPTFQKSHNTAIITPNIELQPTLETQIMNTTELVKVGEHNLNAIQTTIEIIESNKPEKSYVMNETEKIKPIPPFPNDASVKTTGESKTNILHNTLNSKYNLTTIESTVNEISCNNTKKETTIPISSSVEEVEEKNIENHTEIECKPIIDAPSEPDLKVGEMLIGTKAETTAFNVSPTESSVRKIVVEFETKNYIKPIETLAITVYEQIEENLVTAREIESTMNSLTVVLDEKDNIKTDGSNTYYSKVDDKVKTTETKTRFSIDQKNTEKIIEKEPLVQINSKKGVVMEKTKVKIGKENKKIVPTVTSTKSVKEMKEINKLIITFPITSTIENLVVLKKIEDISDTKKTPYTNSSAATGEESPTSINSRNEVMGGNTNVNIDKENETLLSINKSSESLEKKKEKDELIETLLPMESTVESIKESIEDITITSVTSCSDSPKVILDVQTAVVKVIGEEYSAPANSIGEKRIDQEPTEATINYSDEVIAENVNGNIDTDKETLLSIIKTPTHLMEERKVIQGKTEIALPIESSINIMGEPKKVEDIIFEIEITSCTESLTEMIDDEKHAPRIVAQEPPVENSSLDEVIEENTTVYIDTENKTTLFIESIAEPEVEEDRNEKEILSITDSSHATIEAQMNNENYIEEEYTEPINSSNEVLGEKKNLSINKENEKSLPINSLFECMEKNKKIDELIDTLLPMESTVEQVEESIEDTTVTPVRSTIFSNVTIDVQTDEEKVIGEESWTPINFVGKKNINQEPPVSTIDSSDEIVMENINVNIDNENETILPIDKSYGHVKENNEMDQPTETLLPVESTDESLEEPKVVENIILETEISSCNESLTEVIDDENHTARIVAQEHPVESNSAEKVVEDNTSVNIDTENKTTLFIKSIADSEAEENRTEKEILSFTDSSNATIEAQMNEENYIEGQSPELNNSSDEVVGDKRNVNNDIENETLLAIDISSRSVEKNKKKTELINTLLSMKSTIESIEVPVMDRTVTTVTSYTDSSNDNIDVQTDVEKVIREESSAHINSIDEKSIEQEPLVANSPAGLVAGNTNGNIDTEKETLLPIKSSTCSMGELNVIEGTNETEITACTELSTEIIDNQIHAEKKINREPPLPSISSDELLGKNIKVNIHTEKETHLQAELVIESTTEPGVEEDKTEIKITSTGSSSSTVDAQTNNEKYNEGESQELINSSHEVVGVNSKLNINEGDGTLLKIDTSSASVEEDLKIDEPIDTLLPMESTVEYREKPIDDITIAVVKPFTDSSNVTIDVQKDVKNVYGQEWSAQINSVGKKSIEQEPVVASNNPLDGIVAGYTDANIDIECATDLPIESVIQSAEKYLAKYITETEIPSTDSSIVIVDAKINANKRLDEGTVIQINSLSKVVCETTNMNINTEKETMAIKTSTDLLEERKTIKVKTEISLPIESSIDSIVEPEVFKETEFETEMIDDQNRTAKIVVREPPLGSPDEEVWDNTTVDTDTKNKTVLSIKSVLECVEEYVENIIGKKSSSQINCLVEKSIEQELIVAIMNDSDEGIAKNTNENIDTEKETLLPMKPSTNLMEKWKVIEEKTEISLPIDSSIVSMQKPKIVEDIIFETEIASCTKSSTEVIHDQEHTARIVDQESPVVSNSSDELVEENMTLDIDTENKTSIFIEPIAGPEIEDYRTQKELLSLTDSSNATLDAQTNNDMYIEEESQILINPSYKVVGENSNVNIDKEDRTLLKIGTSSASVGENKKIDELIETLLPIESTVEPIEKSAKDLIQPSVTPYTDSLSVTIGVRTDVEKVIGEESLAQINSVVEKSIEQEPLVPNSPPGLVVGNTNGYIDTEKETLLPIKSSTCSMEELNIIEETTEISLPIRSTEEPKVVAGITETKITSCTESSTEVIDNQNHTDRVIEKEHPVDSNSSVEVVGYNTTVDIDTENKTILSIESVIEYIEEYVEKNIGVESSAPINCIDKKIFDQEPPVEKINTSDEIVMENMNVNIDNENETILPIDTSYKHVKENNEIDKLIKTVLPMISTVEPIEKPKVFEDITETEIASCTESSPEVIGDQNHSPRIIDKKSNSSNTLVGENTSVNTDTKNKTPIFIESIGGAEVREDRTEKELLSYTDSYNATVDDQTNNEKYIEGESQGLINSSHEVVGVNLNVNIDKEDGTLLKIDKSSASVEENQKIDEPINTLLLMESTLEYREEPIEEITITTVTPCTDSSNVTIDDQKNVKNIDGQESLAQINSVVEKSTEQEPLVAYNSPDQLYVENTNGNIDTENNTKKETLSSIKKSNFSMEKLGVIEGTTEIILPIGSTEEPKVGAGITESKITSCTESLTKVINDENHTARIVDQEHPVENNSANKVDENNTSVNIDTKNKTHLSIDSVIEYVEEDLEKVIGVDTSASINFIVENNIDQGPPVATINCSGEIVGGNMNVNMDNENETMLPIDTSYESVKENNEVDKLIETVLPMKSTVESIEKPKLVGDTTETEIASCTVSSSKMIDDQNHADKNIDQESVVPNSSSDEAVGENLYVPIDAIMGSIEVSMQVEYIYETEKTPCTNSSTVTVDVQTDVEEVVGEESSAAINSLGEVLGEDTNVNTDTENETDLQIDISTASVAAVIEEKVIENEFSIPIVSSFLVAEKQINVIDSTTDTLSPIETYMTVVEEPNVVGYVPVNEHAAHIDSSTTCLKEQIQIYSETEIETLSLIDDLTESVNEQIVEKNTENKTPALIDSLSEIVGQGYKVDNGTDNQTPLPINSSSTTVDGQIVKTVIKNETSIYCSIGIAEEQTKVNIDNNIETITPIDNFTAPVEEQLNEGYLSENEYTAHIDLVTTVLNNQTKLDIQSENATLLSIDTTSLEEQLDKVEETVKNDPSLLLVFPAETELKGYDKLTNVGTETTSIGTLNTMESRQTLKKKIKEIEMESENETSTPVSYSASIEIEQIDIDNLTEKTLPNDDISNRNTKTNLIGREIKIENSDNPNNCYLKFGETSKMHSLENEEDNLQKKSYGIQKLEMSVQRMKTSDEDYYEKTFVQLEQTEKISKVDKCNVDDENKTIIDDKLYTVNESDLNAILCASSLEEALTLLDSKIKFKFKHKKTSRINAKEYIPKIQTSDSKSSDANTNFTDAREFFKEIEKKSKK